MTYQHGFRATGYPLRLYSGRDALENLPAELKRHRAQRAFVICGRSVSRKTDSLTALLRFSARPMPAVMMK
jgi:alcohol dehydrogenase class IV